MAVALDATSSVNSATNDASDVSFSHTISGSDRILIVDVAVHNTCTPSVAYNGVAMTLLGSVVDNTGNIPARNARFYLLAPATGMHNVVISKGGTSTQASALSHSWTGVKQIHDHASTSNNSSASSISLSGLSGGSGYTLVDYVAGFNSTGSGLSANSGQTYAISPVYFTQWADEKAVGYKDAATSSGYTLGYSQPALMISCTLEAGSQTAPPTLDTAAATSLDYTSATLNGEITDTGGADADERGFVWGTSSQSDPGNTAPASAGYDDYNTDTGTYGTGTFSHSATGLTADTTYYCRAWAHNSEGYSYGDEVSFDTLAHVYGLAGTVSLSGTGVESATVICIRESDDTVVDTTTTASDGTYSFTGLDSGETYHICVEYESGGQKYNAPSLWGVSPYEVS